MINEKILLDIVPKRWKILNGDDKNLSERNEIAWKKIQQNEVIQAFINDNIQFKIAPVSRRSYKTELAKRILVKYCLTNFNKEVFVGLPTYGQAHKVWWDDLKKMFPKFMIKKIYESDLKIQLINQTTIYLIGFDQPARFEGKMYHFGILDEMADIKDGVWQYHILPAISDTKAHIIMIGTPNGIKGDFYKLYEAVLRDPHKFKDYKIYRWNTYDIANKDYIDDLKIQYPDERAFRQEVLGEFVELSGRIYRSYDIDKHENKSNSINLDSNLPIAICMDFNKNCVYELAQIQGNMVNIFDEIYLQDTDITEMNNEIKARLLALCNGNELAAKRLTLNFYGDYTSEQRRDVSVPKLTGSSWKQIQLEFENNGWNFNRKTLHNPHVMDRINAVNFKLAKNEIIHSSKCQELKKDFLNIQYGSDPDKNRTHASDALGYMIHKEFPLGFKSLYSNIEAYL